MTEHLLVYCTAPDTNEAERLGRIVVSERLAACANILPGAQSLYWWQGKVARDTETVLVLKTSKIRFAALERRLADEHPHDCPCIVAIPVAEGHQPFLNWVGAETSQSD